MNSPDDASEQYHKMITVPVPKLIIALSVPAIISMMVTSVYSLVDTYFVSKLGTSATGAVGVVFSLMAIIQAVGYTLGMGSAGVISRFLGGKKNEEASKAASTAFFTALGLGFVITALGLIFLNDLMRLLGATKTILPYAKSYARYILLGAPFMCASFVMSNDLRAEGEIVRSMVGIIAGALLNIALAPLFIFTFNMGIGGAAIATVLSQIISFLILISNYVLKRRVVRIRIKSISMHWSMYRDILITGLPSFFRQGLASVASIALNVSAAVYGDPAVAAMSIVGRAFMFILSTIIGFGQAFQPVAGYNYGANQYDRLKKAYWFCIKTGFVGLAILGAAGFIFAPDIMAVFRRNDPEVIAIGTLAFRMQCAILPLQAVVVISNMLFQSIGKAKQAALIALSRQGICFLPAILVLPRLFGLFGVQISQPVGDLTSFLLCVPITRKFLKQLNEKIKIMPKQGEKSDEVEHLSKIPRK